MTSTLEMAPELEKDLHLNHSLSQVAWQRYQELQTKRTAETLTLAEQTEPIALSDEIEAANAQRIEKLAQLAQVRHTTVRVLMSEYDLLAFSPLNS